ncbi:hypothetical protein [Cryobacterium zhongshanensis]|uniref:Uncharacterized protein n=1 Tax=Cryobacterium zhongshanensis TaxID=2928153 RepID=A0AA41QXU1_9MICO|nr:hypothetical protein [Cryobacterium zhongshanensis]MCI4659636.1 hypothetical protein [Cryobacterium zhongshanensis]
MTTTTTTKPLSIITIAMTQTITTTYRLTEAQLEEAGLPTTVEELSALETDVLGVTLLDEVNEQDYAVTERDIEITAETLTAPEVLAGE